MNCRYSLALLCLGFGVTMSSCGDRTATGPAPATIDASVVAGSPRHEPLANQHHRHQVPNNLVTCRPQKPKIAMERIGPEGGRIKIGPYVLSVPAGALDQSVVISARIRGGESVRVVEFQPDGLVFDKPATLSMSYEHCQADDRDSLRIAVVDDVHQILYYLPTTRGHLHHLIGKVEHFTNYAVAW
jgi:hypothetical protein